MGILSCMVSWKNDFHRKKFSLSWNEILGLRFTPCTGLLLEHRHNQVVLKIQILMQFWKWSNITIFKPIFGTNLWHQIILRHKYCESPAQVGLIFKNVKYLPGEGAIYFMLKKSVIWTLEHNVRGTRQFFIQHATCGESKHGRRCDKPCDKQNQALQRCFPEGNCHEILPTWRCPDSQ